MTHPTPEPWQGAEPPTGLELVRCIATARVTMPRTVVRLSAGRLNLTMADQALAFLAGANSIFDGDKLLTTTNNDRWARPSAGGLGFRVSVPLGWPVGGEHTRVGWGAQGGSRGRAPGLGGLGFRVSVPLWVGRLRV